MRKNSQWYRSLLLSDNEQEEVEKLIEMQNFKQNKHNPLLKALIKNEKDYENNQHYNAVDSYFNFRKYLMIKNTVAYLECLAYLFSLMTFHLTYNLDQEDSLINIFLMVIVTLMKLSTIFFYLASLQQYGEFFKSLGKLSVKKSYFEHYGYGRIVFKCVLIMLHPLFFLNDVKSGITELYFSPDGEYLEFERDFNHYLYLIQFIVIFWFVFFVILENTPYSQTRA